MSYILHMSDQDLFVIEDDGEIIKANECALEYKGGVINFTEKDGLCAYSEFFGEVGLGHYYDDYKGVHLKMIDGGWYSIYDLIRKMNSDDMLEWRKETKTPIYEEIEYLGEKWDEALESLKKMKNIGKMSVQEKKRRYVDYSVKI